MSYYRDLAMYLRGRRLPEGQVASILGEVAEGVRESGHDPQEEFGAAKDYAEKYPPGTTRSARWWITQGFGVLLVFSVVGYLGLRTHQDRLSPLLFGVPAIFYPLGILAAMVAIGIAMDRRLPRGFRPPSRDA